MTANQIATILIDTFRKGNKILIFGCGGSATMADHMAAEFVGKVRKDRIPLPAISLSSNNAIITALANDYGFEWVFYRQVLALARKNDVVIGISTSGKSKSVVYGLEAAKLMRCKVIDFPRQGRLVNKIQDYQLRLMHRVALQVEDAFL